MKDTSAIYLQHHQRIALYPLGPTRTYPFICCHLFSLFVGFILASSFLSIARVMSGFSSFGLLFPLHFGSCVVHPYRSPNFQSNCLDLQMELLISSLFSCIFSFNAQIPSHYTFMPLRTSLRTNLDCRNLVYALFPRAYTSPITYS
jgi:hypothetical protein